MERPAPDAESILKLNRRAPRTDSFWKTLVWPGARSSMLAGPSPRRIGASSGSWPTRLPLTRTSAPDRAAGDDHLADRRAHLAAIPPADPGGAAPRCRAGRPAPRAGAARPPAGSPAPSPPAPAGPRCGGWAPAGTPPRTAAGSGHPCPGGAGPPPAGSDPRRRSVRRPGRAPPAAAQNRSRSSRSRNVAYSACAARENGSHPGSSARTRRSRRYRPPQINAAT